MEISAFKHSLRIEVDKCKDKIRTSLCPPPTPSTTSQPIVRTNRPKKHIDPTARPLPHSRSISQSCAPSPEAPPPNQSPDMETPHASPVMATPLTHALSLQPPPTDVSVGPLEGSFESAMMGVCTSQLTAYEYPPAPSAYEVQGPSNTAVSSLPSQLSSTDSPTADVMAAIMALTSQVSTLSSQEDFGDGSVSEGGSELGLEARLCGFEPFLKAGVSQDLEGRFFSISKKDNKVIVEAS